MDGGVAPVEPLELTILMPCLNEAETLATCIAKAQRFLVEHGLSGEVVIADNGSVDGSQAIATGLGARVVAVPMRGYGAALIGGIEAARGRFIAMGDADDSYDFGGLMPFVTALRGGAELVMGNRFQGGIAKGAMPPLHRYLGNPVLSFLGQRFFGTPIGDFHCGLRAFRRDAIRSLGLKLPGMEYASEMVVKATIAGLDIREVPTTLAPDGRTRAPHLRTWRDGWRHLRFLLLYAPKFLLVYPGFALFDIGLIGVVALMPGDLRVGRVEFGVHTMIFAAMAAIMGAQLIGLGFIARRYGVVAGLWPDSGMMRTLGRLLTVERACLLGGAMLALGLASAVAAMTIWADAAFGAMDPTALMRLTIPAVLLSGVGLQTVVTGFLIGLFDQPNAAA